MIPVSTAGKSATTSRQKSGAPARDLPANERVTMWLKHSALFSHVDGPALQHLADHCVSQTCPAGTNLFLPGTRAEYCYLVVYGNVSLSLPRPDGKEKLIELVGRGDSFGQAALFLDVPYPISGKCLTETLLLQVPRKVLLARLEEDPVLAKKLLTIMATRIHQRVHDIEGYAFRSAPSRLADYLLSLYTGESPSVQLPVSKSILATKLLFAPATFSRILKDWSSAGLIHVQGRSITLLDTVTLRELARCDRA